MTKKEVPSNLEWKKWGEVDPLYGVVSHKGKEKGQENQWTDEDFYQFGKTIWEKVQVYWERYGVDYSSCLEIGCGAGRITLQLAEQFNSVHAIDVSQGMLRYAESKIQKENVNFYLTDGVTIPLPDSSVSAAFSIHVFQHFNSPQIAQKNFSEVYCILQEGGTILIHLPVYRSPARHFLFRGAYRIWEKMHDLVAFFQRRLLAKGKWTPYMRMTYYQIDELFEMLSEIGYQDIELIVLPITTNFAPFPMVFARK